jgi:hypothetical protein
MKDGDIINMNARRAQTEAILSRQLSFLNSRMDAYEKVLASLWAVLRAIFNPLWLQNAVNEKQMALLRSQQEEMDRFAQMRKEEQSKPKLTIVNPNGIKLAVLAMLILTSCVSMKTHKAKVAEAYKTGYETADAECIDLQKRIARYIVNLKERLKRFNQVNEKGELIPLKKWHGTDTWEDDPDPDAPWMK